MLCSDKHKRGFSLIEVLIAMALLSFTLLSLATWQLKVLNSAKECYWQQVALRQLRNMVASVAVGHRDLSQWNKNNRVLLVQGHGHWALDFLALQWRSSLLLWHCLSKPKAHFSCISVEVAL